MTQLDDEDYDPRYRKGIDYFNECDFYEAHEVWENLWADCQGPSRKFYQGMIQAAVCLHHFGNGNVRGARKLYESCRSRYLEAYRPWHLGVDLDKFLYDLEICCAPIMESDDEIPKVEIDPELIPEIHLVPPPKDGSASSA